jgi:steroid delta-isomerase-like uncharacterized protein
LSDPAAARSLVERLVAALNDRSVEAVLDLVGDDVAFDPPLGGRVVGREAVETALIHRLRCWRETLSDLVVMATEDGFRASAEFTARGTYEATDAGMPAADGQRYSLAGGLFVEIDDGRIVRVTEHRNVSLWMAQLAG